MDDERLWQLTVTGAAALGGLAARSLAAAGWRQATGSQPPRNPASPRADWGRALAWAALSGVLVGTARVLSRRIAAEGWGRVRGDDPATVADPSS